MKNQVKNSGIRFFDSTSFAKKIVKPLHHRIHSKKRVKVLSYYLSQLLPNDRSLSGLDVGCANGEITKSIEDIRHNVKMAGVDVLLRLDSAIAVIKYDGKRLPFEDKSYDFTLLIDVLHHTDNPVGLMKECARVSREFILIKDHVCQSWYDRVRLCFMDWIGNRAYNIHLPYNYLSEQEWRKIYRICNVACEIIISKPRLYPLFFSFIFGGRLHLIARLAIL